MKYTNKKISVILHVHNSSKQTKASIKSILSQSFSEFEFIIITTPSNKKINQYIQTCNDERIVILNTTQHSNYYTSLNHGIKRAKGKYITIIRSNHIALSNKLQIQYDYLEQHNELIAVGSNFYNKDNKLIKYTPVSHSDIQIHLLKNNHISISSLMIRTNIIYKLRGYNEVYKHSADYNLYCRLVEAGKIEILTLPLSIHAYYEKRNIIEDYHIRKQYQKTFTNKYKVENQFPIMESDLGFPKMGRIIGLYTFTQYTSNHKYAKLADTLIDKLFNNITTTLPLTLEYGLLGIGCGIIYLLRNNLVEGEEDDILSQVDDSMVHELLYQSSNKKIDWYGIMRYSRLRLQGYKESKNRIIFQQHVIYAIDSMMRRINKQKLNKSIRAELYELYKMKIYPEKTKVAFKTDINNQVISTIQLKPLSACEGTTFIIPIRIDSDERKRNLDMVLNELSKIQNTRIIITEGDCTPRYIPPQIANVTYQFVKDTNPVFHRTKYLNLMLRIAQTEIIGIWDADVIIPQKQILIAINAIRESKAILSFPYEGNFHMIPPQTTINFITSRSFSLLKKESQNLLPQGLYAVGGALFVYRTAYLNIGG